MFNGTELLSSPLRGISISTLKFRISEIQNEAFRPLFGVSLFLLTWDRIMVFAGSVFVPSSGYLYFYREGFNQWKIQQHVFVPSSGYLYFYTNKKCKKKRRKHVFVPSSEYLYFYSYNALISCCVDDKFSSPLRGISISTKWDWFYPFCRNNVFVPSSGYLYFYSEQKSISQKKTSFRPLFGVSLFLPFLVFPLKIQRELSGLRCKRTNQIISCS